MPRDVAELVDILSLEQVDEYRFRGRHPETHMQRSFGGQVLAQGLGAMYGTITDRSCHSLSGYFLRPGRTDADIDYVVQPTRDGGSFSTRRVVAEQHGQPIFVMSASFKTDENGLEHQVGAYQPPPPPDRCPPLADFLATKSSTAREHWAAEWSALDVRYADSTLTNPTTGQSRLLVWVRTTDRVSDDNRLHQQLLAYLSDLTILAVSTITHPVDFYGSDLHMATINHTMWFHRPIRADEWVLYDQESPNAANALGFSLGKLLGRGHTLGASCAQEGLIRLRDDARSQ